MMIALAQLQDWLPVGYVTPAKEGTCPEGWEVVDGRERRRCDYLELAELFEIPYDAETFTMRDMSEDSIPPGTEIIIKAHL